MKVYNAFVSYSVHFKKGVIMVSHSRDEVYQMCSDTVIMHQGMIETLGKTKEIFTVNIIKKSDLQKEEIEEDGEPRKKKSKKGKKKKGWC